MRTETPFLRRPYIYPHRSARMLPRVSRRFAGAVAASVTLTFLVWRFLESLLVLHNAIAFALLDLVGAGDVQVIDTTIFGRVIPVIVTLAAPTAAWVPYVAAVALAAAFLLLALYVPLARGLAVFLLTILATSALAYYLGAPAVRQRETFPVVWTHTEQLVWLVLPSMAALLFVTVQPSWIRGLCWMAGIEAFAISWSAARFVVVLGCTQLFGPIVLPALWFAWGLLADVLYVTIFFSLAVHVNLRLTPERRR